MKLKLNQDGSAVVRNGAPVYILNNGTEREIDAGAAMKLAIGKHFEASPVMEKLNIPHGMAAAFFGESFQVRGNRLVAVDSNGVEMYSSTQHGELAGFDEALERLVASYPRKETILRDGGAPGAGQGGQQGGTINRAQFQALGPQERMSHIKSGGKVVD